MTFDRPFAIGKYEVTSGDFARFVDRARYRTEARRDPEYGCRHEDTTREERTRNSGRRWNRPGFDQTDRHPVTCVSIRDAMAYARWLSQETGHRYRLPGAAEWEYAWRAGSPRAMLYRNRTGISDICRYAHVGRRDCFSGVRFTVEVGSLLQNGIGLHNMHGNVEEITLACFHKFDSDDESLYLTQDGSPENPQDCEYVATWGGSWDFFLRFGNLRVNPASRRHREGNRVVVNYRRNSRSETGFRVVRELPSTSGVQ